MAPKVYFKWSTVMHLNGFNEIQQQTPHAPPIIIHLYRFHHTNVFNSTKTQQHTNQGHLEMSICVTSVCYILMKLFVSIGQIEFSVYFTVRAYSGLLVILNESLLELTHILLRTVIEDVDDDNYISHCIYQIIVCKWVIICSCLPGINLQIL